MKVHITVETLKTIKEGERKAWGLDSAESRVKHSGKVKTDSSLTIQILPVPKAE